MNKTNDQPKVVDLNAWRRSKTNELSDLPSLPPGKSVEPLADEWLVPPNTHPDPSICLSAELLKVLRMNKHTVNPADMLVALSLAYTGVVRTFELQYGAEEAQKLVIAAEQMIQFYKAVFRHE